MDRPALGEDKELFSVIFTTLPKYVHALLDKKVSEETVSKEILRGVSKQEAIARELYKDVLALYPDIEVAKREERERIEGCFDKEWIQNRANEIALEQTGHEFHDLGPHLQLISYMRAMADYIDRLPK